MMGPLLHGIPRIQERHRPRPAAPLARRCQRSCESSELLTEIRSLKSPTLYRSAKKRWGSSLLVEPQDGSGSFESRSGGRCSGQTRWGCRFLRRDRTVCAATAGHDPHVRATVLYREVTVMPVGYDRSYQTLTRQIRDRRLRPHCEACAGSKGRAHADIAHPSGAETQWDWLELAQTPWGVKGLCWLERCCIRASSGAGSRESDDQAHLVIGIHEILTRFGGSTPSARACSSSCSAILCATSSFGCAVVARAKYLVQWHEGVP